MDVSVSDTNNNAPLCASTPKTSRKKANQGNNDRIFTCQYCDKEYKLKFYFDRHVKSHGVNLSSSNDSGLNSGVHLDVSNITFSALNASNASFKVPALPAPSAKNKPGARVATKAKPKTKAKFICTYCQKGYACSRSFKSHCRTHAIQDGAARFPDKKFFLENVQDIATFALTEVANAPCSGPQGAIFKQQVGFLVSISTSEDWENFSTSLCEKLLDSVVTVKCLLPSALLSSLFNRVEDILSDSKLCEDLLENLNFPLLFSQHMQSLFFLEFVLHFAKGMYSFISKTFRSGHVKSQKPPPVLDDEDREVIYYIGGSIIRGYVRIGKRYKNSKTWEQVVNVLKCNALQEEPTMEVQKYAKWTVSLDRGGLLFINSKCHEFFVGLTPVVFSCEKKDGSIEFEEVIKKVCESDLVVKWDSIISNSLSESNSLNLMNDVIRCFSRTCCRGFAKRRLNFLKKHCVVSMPTRHAVARRKKSAA